MKPCLRSGIPTLLPGMMTDSTKRLEGPLSAIAYHVKRSPSYRAIYRPSRAADHNLSSSGYDCWTGASTGVRSRARKACH